MRNWTRWAGPMLCGCALLGCEIDSHIADLRADGGEAGSAASEDGGDRPDTGKGDGAVDGGSGSTDSGSGVMEGGMGSADAGKPTQTGDASADTGTTDGGMRSCDCALELYVAVCGVDGQSYDATCGRHCVPVQIACEGECPCPNTDAGLRWYESCGDPVCGISADPYDTPNIPNCTTEKLGAACASEGGRCDGVLSCGATMVCAKSDPTMRPGGCPISRARYKEDVAYLSPAELRAFHEQLMQMPLASYRYKHAPGAGPQLGFIIDDIEPSVAVSGDHVNMYGYLSMAVAAIKVQQQRIEALERELRRLRVRKPGH